VEIDELKKSQAAILVKEDIPHPDKITKLQHDMDLANDKKLYSHCRVGFFLTVWLRSNAQNRQLFEML